MSLWTDRELKKLIVRVNELEGHVAELEQHSVARVVRFGLGEKQATLEPPDKRTKAWREWNNANS